MRLVMIVWNVLLFVGVVYGLGMSVFVASHLWIGERLRWVAFANNFIAWWALGSALIILVSLFSSRRWLVIAPQLPILLLFLALYGSRLRPHSEIAHASQFTGLTAATYNILSPVSDPEQVVATIAGLNADIVGIQELADDHAAEMDRALAERYPYRVLHPLGEVDGVGLLSRYPILHSEVFLPLPDSMRFLRAEIDMNGVPVVVYVVHPQPPDSFTLPWQYDSSRRDEELRILRENYLAKERDDVPLIMLGDFNMTDQSRAYQAIHAHLNDSFREAGYGLGFTWPAESPTLRGLLPRAVRIDYIWHNDPLMASSARVAEGSGTSDHRPVIATLSLRTESVRSEP